MRHHLWKIHAVLGLICGLPLILISLSGSILVFDQDIESFWNKEAQTMHEPSAEKLPFNELVAQVGAEHPGYWITAYRRSDNDAICDMAFMAKIGEKPERDFIWVNPYTGQSSGTPHSYYFTFTGWMLKLHYTLFADDWGMAFVALIGIFLIILGITGIFLYRKFWKSLFRLRLRKSARILFSDFHKMVGILSIPFNIAFGFTGAYWNIMHLSYELKNTGHGDAVHSVPLPVGSETDFEAVFKVMDAKWPGYETNYVRFPSDKDGFVTVFGRIPASFTLNSRFGSSIRVNAETQEIAFANDISEQGLWKRFTDTFRPIHFGDFGGIWTKIIWSIAGLTPGLLALSGTGIWYVRKFKKRKKS